MIKAKFFGLLSLLILSSLILTGKSFGICNIAKEISKLESTNQSLRLDASRNLLFCIDERHKNLAQTFVKILDDETSPKIRANLIAILGKTGSTRAFYAINEYIDDSNPIVRSNVAVAYGKLRFTKAIKKLISLLDDEAQLVRGQAAFALSLFGKRVGAKLKYVIKSDRFSIRQKSYACLILGDIGYVPSLYWLLGIASDNSKDENLIRDAKEGIARMISYSLQFNTYNKVKAKLLKFLGSRREGIQKYSIVMVGNLGEIAALSELRKIKKDKDNPRDIRRQAEIAIEKIMLKSRRN